jgi:hypothetical protein
MNDANDDANFFFPDLLKVADAVSTTYPKAIYKGKPVEIIEQRQGSALSTVKWEGGSDEETFSVPSQGLQSPKAVAPKPVIAPTSEGDFAALASYLESTGYSLFALQRQPDERPKILAEYAEWTGGEDLPETSIKDYSATPGSFFREWVVRGKYSEDMPSPVPIEEGGSIGRGRGHLAEPHGLKNGKSVLFNSPETVAELVRAGLRAR